jgi:hypothetical protein
VPRLTRSNSAAYGTVRESVIDLSKCSERYGLFSWG